MQKKWLKRLMWLLLLVVAAGLLWYFFKPQAQISYLTDKVVRGNIEQTVNATGEISAVTLVDVGAQASGQIKKLHVKLGQEVKKGDLIAEIDATSQLNTLNTNKSRLQTAQAQLVSAQVKLKSAQRQYDREQALWREEATSKQALENAEDALASAKASVTEIKASIKQTQIAINTAEADLNYTRIVAPMDGTVVSTPVAEGQTVNAVQSAPKIVQIADLSMMLNRMQIAEGDVTQVKAGLPMSFTILSEPDYVRHATLESLDPGLISLSLGSYSTSTDTSSSAVYYYARALVPNDDGKLHIGMTTQNSIVIQSAKDVITVANQAIQHKDGTRYVRVLDEQGQVEEVAVKTGLTDGMRTQIVSGLQEGQEAVIAQMTAAEVAQSADVPMRRPRR